MKMFLIAFTMVMSFGLSSCSSLNGLKQMAMGGDAKKKNSSRNPASVSSAGGSVLIENKQFAGDMSGQPIGADLGKGEFGTTSQTIGSKDPWFGTGPTNEGSLWNGESQDNFYFTMNTSYKVGDIIMVKLDTEVNDALNSRIAALLGESGKSTRKVVAEELERGIASEVGKKVGKAVKNENIAKAIGRDVGDRVKSSLDLKESYVNVDEIPVRITGTLDARMFKIEGSRRVFIKNAPYQVAMSGSIRHEDVSPDGSISSQKVLESKLELTK